jgi:hypothetical protein
MARLQFICRGRSEKNTAKLEIDGEQGQTPRWYLTLMAVSISCPQLGDAALRTQLTKAVQSVVKRWRPSFERWRLSLFRSQSGDGWDLAISGPRFRKIFTLNGPVDDLPGLVSAYIDAILAQVTDPSHARPRPSGF